MTPEGDDVDSGAEMTGFEDMVWDVVIVGYGPAGEACANLLGARGLHVLVIERDMEVFPRQRAIAIDDEALRVVREMGLYDEATAHMHLGVSVEFVGVDGRPFLTMPSAMTDACRHPQVNFFHQPELERVLREGLRRYPNVRVECGWSVRDVNDHGDGVSVEAVDPEGRAVTVQGSWLLACDGGSSTVRKVLEIPFAGDSYEEQWFDLQVEVKRPFARTPNFRFICDPDRPGVDCPCPGGYHRWEWRVNKGEDVEDMKRPKRQWEMLAERGVGPQDVEIKRSWEYTFHVRKAKTWRKGRVLLVGDAAHVMPPFAGQGISGAFRDAANACWKLARVAGGQADESLLDTYQLEREAHHDEMSNVAVGIGRVVMVDDRTRARVRDAYYRALSRIGGVRRAVNRRALRSAPLAAGLLAARRPDKRAVGHLVPLVDVFVAGTQRVKIDAALGDGFSVLGIDVDPASALGDSTSEAWRRAGASFFTVRSGTSVVADGEIGDPTGELWSWFGERGARLVVIRPDRYIYDAGVPGAIGMPPGPIRAARMPAAAGT